MKIILSSSPGALRAELAVREALAGFKNTATVEAEYGEAVVEGSALTFAHHGPRKGNPCPCSYGNDVAVGTSIEVIGISHVDLDTLGGVLAIMGKKPEAPSFWCLAEYVDVNGAHKIASSGASEADVRRIHAFWAWSEANRVFAPRDGSCADATAWFAVAGDVITRILAGDESLLARGDEHRAAGEKLNSDSFDRAIKCGNGKVVIMRVSEAFTNHLYSTPSGIDCECVIAFNPKVGSVTISFADDSARAGLNARSLVQSLWGALAGGHDGIAGSPRGQAMTEDDATRLASLVFNCWQ